MGKRFAGTTDSVTFNGATFLNGFDFRFGTLACVINFQSIAVANTGIFITNLAVANAVDFYIAGITNRMGWYDGTNFRETTTLAVVTGETLVLVATKATGTATPRMHMYRPSTNVWTHENTNGTSPDGAAATQFMIGDNTGTIPANFELFQLAAWNKVIMTDSEVERVSKIPEMNWQRLESDLYIKFAPRNESGDVVRTFGRFPCRQSARAGTVRGTIVTPGALGFCPIERRR